MGGCCSSSRKYQLHGTPVYYYCPSALEEPESTTPRDSSFSTRLLIDVNLDTSIPDTYRAPPTPIPFDVVLGIPQTTNTTREGQGFGDIAYQKPTPVNVKKFEYEVTDDTTFAEPPKKLDDGFQTSKSLDCSMMEEDDICPTCFEEYDADNPKKLLQNVTISFTFRAFSSGWKEATLAPSAVRKWTSKLYDAPFINNL